MKGLTLRRSGVCATCSSELAAGVRAWWNPATKNVHCLSCGESRAPEFLSKPATAQRAAADQPRSAGRPVPQQSAGGSAQREFERRSEKREQRIRSAHPKLGGLILALTDDPASTRVWAQGAAGERAVGGTLDGLVGEHAVVLHDRAQRRPDGRTSKANIDHLAVSASGVWVIDAKTHQGSLEVRRSGGLFSPRVERLYIRGRDQTRLVEGLHRQVAAVRAELARANAEVPVHGALCFVGTELPWFGASAIAEVRLVGRRGLAKLLKAPGEMNALDRETIAEFLDGRFVPAVA
jgi:hypothetical protein